MDLTSNFKFEEINSSEIVHLKDISTYLELISKINFKNELNINTVGYKGYADVDVYQLMLPPFQIFDQNYSAFIISSDFTKENNAIASALYNDSIFNIMKNMNSYIVSKKNKKTFIDFIFNRNLSGNKHEYHLKFLFDNIQAFPFKMNTKMLLIPSKNTTMSGDYYYDFFNNNNFIEEPFINTPILQFL